MLDRVMRVLSGWVVGAVVGVNGGCMARRIILATTLLANINALAAYWHVYRQVDDFDGTVRVAAYSTAFGEPFGKSDLWLRCTNGEEVDAFFTFQYLNRAGRHDGPIRMKFGNDAPLVFAVGTGSDRHSLFISRTSYTSERGDLATFLRNLVAADGKVLKLRLTYYGTGVVTLSFPLVGAAKAVTRIAAECGESHMLSDPPSEEVFFSSEPP